MKYFLSFLLVFCSLSCKRDKLTRNKTVEETESAPKKQIVAPLDKMIFFKGGNIIIGADDRTPIEAPAFKKTIAPFYLDAHLVSVADFRKFIEATNHKTEAEKFGDSAVFDFKTLRWNLVKQVNWEYPFGINQGKAPNNHPVTHISWNDATAYAKWAGKRLPTEFEWEFAAKNGENIKYPWGNTEKINEKWMANVWNGNTIQNQTVLDGYLHTSPIGVFGKSKAGLYDMVGNVWQWTSTVFEPYDKSMPYQKNPQNRVTRGGSFMFDQALALSYTTTFRAQNTTESSLFNTGFRCAKSAKNQ